METGHDLHVDLAVTKIVNTTTAGIGIYRPSPGFYIIKSKPIVRKDLLRSLHDIGRTQCPEGQVHGRLGLGDITNRLDAVGVRPRLVGDEPKVDRVEHRQHMQDFALKRGPGMELFLQDRR